MVSSVDGKAANADKVMGLGSSTDRWVMRILRGRADAVMIGAGTLRAERLSLGLDEVPGVSQPIAVVVTQTGENLPIEENLIPAEGQRVMVLVPGCLTDGAQDRLRNRLQDIAEVISIPASRCGSVDLDQALKILRRDHSVEHLLIEGGPALNQAVISRGLADQLCLTLAPKLLGGNPHGPRTILEAGQVEDSLAPRYLSLLSAYLSADELFLRYAINNTQ